MKNFLTNSIVWAVIVAVAYFATDIIDKGLVLNNLTPFPFLGYALWLAIAMVLWMLFFQPLISFCRLGSAGEFSPEAQLNQVLKALASYRSASEGDPRRELFVALYYAKEKRLYKTKEGREELSVLMERYHALLNTSEQERKLIRSYSTAAGIGVVFSRNSLLDGIVVLVMQLRLVIALAKLRGYRPSPVFNLCCLSWVLTNSLVTALAQGTLDEMVEAGADYIVELIFDPEDAASALSIIPKTTLNLATQAVLAGTSLYITGTLFQWRLNRDAAKLTMNTLLELRRQGRKEMGKALMTALLKKAKGSIGLSDDKSASPTHAS